MSKNIIAVIGSQWGDEGKGKITDVLSQTADFIVRYAGGDNAGHTVVFENHKYQLSAIPTGVFNPKAICVIGNGCVLNLERLITEIDYLTQLGIKTTNLKISNRVQLIMPYHLIFDGLQENNRETIIGTTKRGIGPCYEDKYARCGFRIAELANKETFFKKLKTVVESKNKQLKLIYNHDYVDANQIYTKMISYYDKIKHMITDTSVLIDNAIKADKTIVFEGAQGAMLDIDFGTYPYVTSSHPTTAGIASGIGIAPNKLNRVVGIMKAYTTRVGSGPFPSEIPDLKLNNYIREKGHEYGVVSKRARRVGWLDLCVVKTSIRLNGFTEIVITLLDVLSGLSEIKVCVGYNMKTGIIMENTTPATIEDYSNCEPVYKTFKGWKEDISETKTYSSLPQAAKDYVSGISELLNITISAVSVGPDRTQTLIINSNDEI